MTNDTKQVRYKTIYGLLTEGEMAARSAASAKLEEERILHRMLLAAMTNAEFREHLDYAWEEKREALASLPIDKRIQAIWEGADGPGIDSTTRLEALLGLCLYQPPEVFWPAFTTAWAGCDDTTARGSPRHSAFATRPPMAQDELHIWRGCSRSRVRGISWTTDRAVAEGFARGHRGIKVPDAVVAEAWIRKAGVFAVVDDERQEAEVLIDPRRLRRLVIHQPAHVSDGGIPGTEEWG